MDAPIDVLLQHWPGVLFRQAPDHRLPFVGSRISEWTGHPPESFAREPARFIESIHEADAERVREHLLAAATRAVRLRFRFRHAHTGRITHISEFRQPVRGKSGDTECHEGFWEDDSRLAHAEGRLESAAWAESLARLTPGFAHDFNNVIAGVHGFSDTFLSQLEPGHPFQEGLTLIKRNTHQAAQFVQRLQQLHLPRSGERAYHDLNAVVKDAAECLARGLGRDVELATEFAPGPLPIHACLAGLQQVIFALAFNAVDAMTIRGRLLLRTSVHAEIPGAGHAAKPVPGGACVCLSVQDAGPGITARHLAGLFTPGFTTKPGRHGVGVGLQHARRFAQSHHGALTVEPGEGTGATVHLWLPRAQFTEGEGGTGAANPIRNVLLAGQPPATWSDIDSALRAAGARSVIADANAEELLASPDFEFDVVLLRPAPADAGATRLIQFIRRHRLPVRLIVQPLGCGAENIPQIEKADVILDEHVSAARVAERILSR